MKNLNEVKRLQQIAGINTSNSILIESEVSSDYAYYSKMVEMMTDPKIIQSWISFYKGEIEDDQLKQIILSIVTQPQAGFKEYIQELTMDRNVNPISSGSSVNGFYDFDIQDNTNLTDSEFDELYNKMDGAYYDVVRSVKKQMNESSYRTFGMKSLQENDETQDIFARWIQDQAETDHYIDAEFPEELEGDDKIGWEKFLELITDYPDANREDVATAISAVLFAGLKFDDIIWNDEQVAREIWVDLGGDEEEDLEEGIGEDIDPDLIDYLNSLHDFDDIYFSGEDIIIGNTYDEISSDQLEDALNEKGINSIVKVTHMDSVQTPDGYWDVSIRLH